MYRPSSARCLMSSHAKLAASTSHRWIHCPGSVRVCAPIPNKPSAAATKGTAAHHLGFMILSDDPAIALQLSMAGSLLGYTFLFEDDGVWKTETVDEQMLDAVTIHVDNIRALMAEHEHVIMMLEQRFSLKHIHEDVGGTADAVLDEPIILTVIDYKNGFIAVNLVEPGYDPDAPDLSLLNSQLLIYAAGAAHESGWMHDFIRIQICQPNCLSVRNVQSVTIPTYLLKSWVENDLPRYIKATEDPDAPLVSGPHCFWCPASETCPAQRQQAIAIAQTDFDGIDESLPPAPELLSQEQMLKVLKWAPVLYAWLDKVDAYAFRLLQEGVDVPYKKLGLTNPNRKWPENVIDAHKLAKRLREAGAPDTLMPDQLYSQPELLSPSQVEKTLLKGNKGKDIVNQVAIKPPGKVTMVDATDARPEFKRLINDFKGVDDE